LQKNKKNYQNSSNSSLISKAAAATTTTTPRTVGSSSGPAFYKTKERLFRDDAIAVAYATKKEKQKK